VAPRGAPVVDVITAAKRDLRAGQVLNGFGGFDCYGLIENADQCHNKRLLPMSASEGCRLERDEIIAVDDIELPHGRLCDRLRREQDLRFASSYA
jgi:predicted homoserine dehydrogenase-like protein